MPRANDTSHASWLLPLAVLSAGAIAVPSPARAEQPIAIVVDRDNPRSDIGLEELRSLFLGRRGEWPDGARAVPVDLESGPLRRAFCGAVLRMSEAEYDRYWVDQRVRGAGAGPRPLATAGLVLRFVARVRGAVGYLPWSRVDGSVKVLTVGGLRPDQRGYPLVGDVLWADPALEGAVAAVGRRASCALRASSGGEGG